MSDILQQTNLQSISKIFNKKPEDITDEDLEIVVAVLRKDRENFTLQEKTKTKVKASPDLSLKDLDL